MDPIFSFNITDPDASSVAPDNNSSALQTDPNYPANLPDSTSVSDPFGNTDDIFSRAAASVPQNLVKRSAPYDASLVEKYRGTAAYSPYMSPYGDAEKIAANNWGMWDAVATGLSGLTDNAINAGKEYAYGWVRAGRALASFDTDYLTPSDYETRILGIEQKLVSQKNPIFYDPGTEDDIFTRGFAAEFLQNTGFTFGTLGGFLTETALLGGVGKLFTKLPKLFKMGAAAKSVRMAEQGVTAGSKLSYSQLLEEQARNMYGTGIFTGKTIMDNALNVASKLPIIGAVADAGKTIRAARSLGAVEGAGTIALTGTELAKIGAGGLKRAFSEWNFAASEAAIEAGGTYGEVYDSLYDMYVARNDGKTPEGEELQKIRELALDASGSGYNTNFAVLALMNRIQFGNLFRNFGTDSKFLSLLRSDADRVIAVNGIEQGGKALTKAYTKGYLGVLGHRSDIIKTFNKPTFYRELGRDFIRGAGRIEITEGLQENIQEGTNEFLKSYYADLYDDNVANFGPSFKEAFESQTTKRGFKTFLQGALTGFAIRPVTGAAQAARNAYLEKQAAKANPEHVNALQATLNRLNLAMANPEKILRENHRVIKEQVMLNDGMTKGAAVGDKYAYLNNKDSAIIRLALDAKRTGTFDAFKTMLTNYGQSLDNEEFKEATGINLEAEGVGSAAEYTTNLVNRLDRYSKGYDKYSKLFSDYLSLDGVIQDDYSKQRFKFAQASIQDAIHTAAFNEAKAEASLQRAASIAQDVSKIRGIGQSAAANFNTITDHGMAKQQINIVNNEIKTLQESGPLTPQTKALIALKEKERDLLTEWTENAYSEEVIATDAGEISNFVPINYKSLSQAKQNQLAKILSEYYTVKNQQSGSAPAVLDNDVKSVLDSINDYQKLSRDTKDYIAAVNLLSDPKNLIRAAHAYEDARVAAYARLTHDTFLKLAEESEIFANYLKDNPKELENLLKIARTPLGSYDNVSSVMQSVMKINALVVEDEQKTAEAQAAAQAKAQADAQAAAQAAVIAKRSAAVNIRAMSAKDASDFVHDHYEYIDDPEDPEGPALGFRRYFIDDAGNKVITHEILNDLIEKQYPGVDIKDFYNNDTMISEFVRSFEQEMFYRQNPTISRTDQEPIQRRDAIINESKKLWNLVDQKVLYLGKPGTLKKDDKNYFIEYEDGETTILGKIEEDPQSKFRWRKVRNKLEYKLEEINPNPIHSTDNYPYLHILPDAMTEEERRLTGESLDAIAMRVQGERINVQYRKDPTGETIDIGGNVFRVQRDDSGAIESMSHEFDAGTVLFTKEEAEREPDGLASKYFAIANMAYIHDADLSETQVDTAIQKAQEQVPSVERVVVTARERGVKARETIKQTEGAIELIGRIMESVPDELVDAFDDIMSMNSARLQQLPRETKLKLLDWAQGAVKKLNNLDKNNPDVISYITLLNDLIIGPLAKKDGRTSTERQPKKATSKENETPVAPAPTAPAPGEPSAPSSYKREQGSVTKAAAHVNRNYNKKDKELAVKIEELLPAKENLINRMEIEAASDVSKFNKRSYRSAVTKKRNIPDDPYNNPPLTCS